MFSHRLDQKISEVGNPCSIGLDPSLDLIPDEFWGCAPDARSDLSMSELASVFESFGTAIIESVKDLVPVVKPQIAFFEVLGSSGLRALENLIKFARSQGLLVVLDAKRGDVPSTAEAYAKAYLATKPPRPFECDAMTVSPYLGLDSLLPFCEQARAGKGVFVCVKTSNPGSRDLQQASVSGVPLYAIVAELLRGEIERAKDDSGYSNIGFVVGGQHAEDAAKLRREFPHVWFLVPGIGAQGGSADAIRPFFDARGRGVLVSSSRAVLYPQRFGSASKWSRDAVRDAACSFASASAQAALR